MTQPGSGPGTRTAEDVDVAFWSRLLSDDLRVPTTRALEDLTVELVELLDGHHVDGAE